VPVEELARRWSPLTGGGARTSMEPRIDRGAHSPMEEPTRWRAILRWDERGRVGGGSRVGRSRGGCGRTPGAVVESRDQAGPQGGRVHDDDVGRQRWLGRSAGAPFSGGTDVEASVANHGPGGAVEDGGRLQTMWPAAAWWNPSSYGTPFI
jgi:hypothetical protein